MGKGEYPLAFLQVDLWLGRGFNRAIAHLLLNFGMVHHQAEEALDIYFRQRAILVTCRDLAVMGSTLANMGRNPLTGDSAFEIGTVKSMLAIMFTCGMYDYSGEWAYRVGVPAKSGAARFGLHAFDCLNAGSSYLDGVL